MGQKVKCLIVEDSEVDADLLVFALRKGGYEPIFSVVDTPEAMRASLEEDEWDVITSDHSMPRFSAPAALAIAREICPDVPFIIVSGEIDINLAVSLMKLGAHDYIQKHELERVAPAIERELKDRNIRREHSRSQAELWRTKEFLEQAQQASGAGVWDWNMDTGELEWSVELFRMFGLDPDIEKASFERWRDILHPQDREIAEYRIKTALKNHTDLSSDYRIIQPGGRIRWISASGRALYNDRNRPVRMTGTCIDITERKRIENEREGAVTLLALAHKSGSIEELIHGAVVLFRDLSGCEAVGVRLRRDHDFPYYETHGFPEEFVRLETKLCARDEEDMPMLDEAGEPVLECMCGNVIQGRFDPSKPFFTAKGSFWTNSTSELLASTTEADRQARTRNRCNGEGYESVALVALRAEKTPLGLIQMNDRRRNRFCLEDILHWERLSDYLAAALAKFIAQEALQESEERFRLSFDNMMEGYAECKLLYSNGVADDFLYLRVNKAYTALTGLENVEGKRFTEILPGVRESNPEILSRYDRAVRAGTMERFESFSEAFGGWLSVSAYSTGKDRFVAIFENITERKRAEEAARRLNEVLEQRVVERTVQLEKANNELEAFAYSVSHDLKAPLRHIQGYAGYLREMAAQWDEDGLFLLNGIETATRKMGALIDDLLSLSRMERVEIDKKQIELTGLVRDVISEIMQDVGDREIDWRVGSLPTVTADRAMLRIVLSNLFSNAVKYTRNRDKAVIEVGDRSNSAAEDLIYVRDNGVGFDIASASKLFTAFQRLHPSSRFEGTGVGLASVHRIISRHGGRTWAEGVVDEGAVFYFTLPRGEIQNR